VPGRLSVAIPQSKSHFVFRLLKNREVMFHPWCSSGCHWIRSIASDWRRSSYGIPLIEKIASAAFHLVELVFAITAAAFTTARRVYDRKLHFWTRGILRLYNVLKNFYAQRLLQIGGCYAFVAFLTAHHLVFGRSQAVLHFRMWQWCGPTKLLISFVGFVLINSTNDGRW
jgi:hypothetical protein